MSGERIETAGEAFDGGTAVWGTCDSCLATVVVYPRPDRGSDLPDHREWEGGFPDECPVCDEPMDWEGTDPTYDVVLDRGAWQQRVAEAEERGAREFAAWAASRLGEHQMIREGDVKEWLRDVGPDLHLDARAERAGGADG